MKNIAAIGGRTRQATRGFTLIELLTVITIIAVLTAVLIPAVSKVMGNARKAAAASNLRQLAIAYADYVGGDGRPRALTAPDIYSWALLLARETGINDPELYIIPEDPLVMAQASLPRTVAYRNDEGNWTLDGDFNGFPLSFAVVSGLNPNSPASTTPVAWTRGLAADGTWRPLTASDPGVYGDEGGHVVFLDGHVEYFRNLRGADGTGVLVNYTSRRPTANILEAISPGAVVLQSAAAE